MFYLSMAGLNVAVRNDFDLFERECADYVVDRPAHVDFEIDPTEEEEREFKRVFLERWGTALDDAQAEERASYAQLYGTLPRFGRFWIHAVLVGLDGWGYAFSAPSGTGKTTHARLWLREFPGARIVNGDLPVVCERDGAYWGWGTPFCGKEHYQVNCGVPLRGLAFIERGQDNAIEPLPASEAFGYLVNDHRTWMGPENQELYLDLFQRFVETVPLWRLTANMTQEAARVAHAAMSGGA